MTTEQISELESLLFRQSSMSDCGLLELLKSKPLGDRENRMIGRVSELIKILKGE
jgi:hypothetical protein